MMNADSNFVSPGPSSARRGAGDEAPRVAATAQKLLELVRRLPTMLQDEIRKNPTRAIALVGSVGFGAGVVLGSRIARTILVSVGTYAVTEVLRSYVSEQLQGMGADGDPQARTQS